MKGDKSQYKSWRGHGVTHEVHQIALKWTKMDKNGHHIMTEQKSFEFVLSYLNILFMIKWTLEREKKSVQAMEGSWSHT